MPGRMLLRIYSIVLWGLVGLIVLLWLPMLAVLYVLTVPFDPGRYAVGRWFRVAAMMCVKVNPIWRFRWSGRPPADPRRPYVVVSNHESFTDILLISHLPWEMKWLSKHALFRIPVMGWEMRLAGDIEVHRGRTESRVGAVKGIRDRLAKRVSVMIFPEGTRSRTDDLLPFQDGAFRVAVETGTPILPLALAGTRSALAKGSFMMAPARAEVRVLEPIEVAGLSAADVPALRDRVRALIDEARRDIRRGLEGRATASAATPVERHEASPPGFGS